MSSLYDDVPWPAVSVVMAVRDEERHLDGAIRAALAQDYPGRLELLVAVAPSSDRTAEVARAAAAADGRVTVVANPRVVTPAGLNAAIEASSGAVVVRVDGHAYLPPRYVRRAVELLEETGAANVGGIMAAEGTTPFERAVAAAMSSRFGTGDARFHYGGEPGPVDTVYLGVFPRETLDKVGGYDEGLVRAQDAELNHRIREAGGVVYFHPDLRVSYRPRGSLRALARQYYHSGRWRRAVVRRHPRSLAWRQLAPPGALLAMVAASLLPGPIRRAALLPPVVYALAVVAGSVTAGRGLPWREARWLPVVFPVMHGCWAVGFLTSPRRLGRPAPRETSARMLRP